MSETLARAHLLLSQSRFDLAEEAARKAVVEDPNDPFARAFLATALLGRKNYKQATQEAAEAIRLRPDLPYAHYVNALVLLERDRYEESEVAIQEAIRLDPEDGDHWGLLARARIGQKRWKDALEAAERGLACDAEDVDCLNVRALALTQLGRKDEAFYSVDQALARDPENAQAHYARGWAYLHAGDYQKALEHFRETLRIDPTMEGARHGIVEALKARNFIYRIMLRYFLWMSRLSGKASWAFIIGLYVLARVLQNVAKSNPSWAPFVWPLLGFYLVFVLLTWTASPLFNLLLRLNRYGRLALDREEIVASNLVGGCVALALLSGLGGLLTRAPFFGLSALVFFLLIIPVAGIFRCRSGRPRNWMIAYTVVMALAGMAMLITLPFGGGFSKERITRNTAGSVFSFAASLFFFGAVLSSWVAIGISRMRVRK